MIYLGLIAVGFISFTIGVLVTNKIWEYDIKNKNLANTMVRIGKDLYSITKK